MNVLKLLWLSLALLLVSSTTASSFSSSRLPLRSRDVTTFKHRAPLVLLRGGSDESAEGDEEAPPPPPPEAAAAVPEVATTAVTSTSKLGPNAAPPGLLRRTFPNLPWHRLPNFLTYLRCIAIPLLVVLFYKGLNGYSSLLFGLASFTDWLDGYLARRWDITSSFGAFLDPVADKLMVSTALVLLTGKFGQAVAIPTIVIIGREIAVSALREWMAQRNMRDSVQVGFQGKLKTAATMIALTLMLLVASPYADLYKPSVVLLDLCALLTVTSGSVYFRAAAPVLLESESK